MIIKYSEGSIEGIVKLDESESEIKDLKTKKSSDKKLPYKQTQTDDKKLGS